MGSSSAVMGDSKGNIWVFERCGANSCADSTVDPILVFDPSGKLLRSFGAGKFVFPHGVEFDADGNFDLTTLESLKNCRLLKRIHVTSKITPSEQALETLRRVVPDINWDFSG